MLYDESQVDDVAKMVLEEARRRRASDRASLITFSGDLGAGKTTLIQEIARQLKIIEIPHSPTFVIYKKYEIPDFSQGQESTWNYLIHGDMYRLESPDEIEKLGWQELLSDPKNLICIEWPEKIYGFIPEDALKISLQYLGNARDINYEIS